MSRDSWRSATPSPRATATPCRGRMPCAAGRTSSPSASRRRRASRSSTRTSRCAVACSRPSSTSSSTPPIALRPSHLSINGGGNDILRPRVTIDWVSGRLEAAVHRILDAGIVPVMVSGANPSGVMAGGGVMRRRGDALRNAVRTWADELDVPFVDNWTDVELQHGRFWTDDRLHLNAAGHARAATTFLHAIGRDAPAAWSDLVPVTTAEGRRDARYYRTHVLPWVGRRLTGRSSGDGRTAKIAVPVEVEPLG